MARRRQPVEESQGPGVKPFTAYLSGPSGRDSVAMVTIIAQ
jgi:hypothetical protein